MSLQPDEVKKIAHLARLTLEEHQIDRYAKELSDILLVIEQMNQIDTSHIAPLAHSQKVGQRLRKDAVTEHNQRDQFLALAPKTDQGLFLVPKVIE